MILNPLLMKVLLYIWLVLAQVAAYSQIDTSCVEPKRFAYSTGDRLSYINDSLLYSDYTDSCFVWVDTSINKISEVTYFEYEDSPYSISLNLHGNVNSVAIFRNNTQHGPYIVVREDGYYTIGHCEEGLCGIKEYYPNGRLYQEYSTIDGSLLTGDRKAYDQTGNLIYSAKYKHIENTGDNFSRYHKMGYKYIVSGSPNYFSIILEDF
jgi:hypothetical protein